MFGSISADLLIELARSEGLIHEDKNLIPYVFVNPKYLISVQNGFDVINSNGNRYSSIGSEDHPFFNSTRKYLEQTGYIKCEHSWVNGDRVIKPFYFNNVLMNVNENFASACAMKYSYSDSYNNGNPL